MKETTNNKAAWEKIFRELDILGRIARTDPFIDVVETPPSSVTTLTFPNELITLTPTSITSESNVNREAPFPQADKFGKVLAMLTAIDRRGTAAKRELTLDFDIVDRQIDYYYNTLRFMGLAESNRDSIWLTERGRKIARLPYRKKLRDMARIVFSEPIFNVALKRGVDAVDDTLFSRWGLGGSTIPRRKKTVRSWIEYFRGELEGLFS